jgi:hypothetical protein
MLVGRPPCEAYEEKCNKAAEAIEAASKVVKLVDPPTIKDVNHRRGQYLAKTFGFSHGHGRTVSTQIWLIGL